MVSDEDRANIKAWAEAHVDYGLVQARIALALCNEFAKLTKENEELRKLNNQLQSQLFAGKS